MVLRERFSLFFQALWLIIWLSLELTIHCPRNFVTDYLISWSLFVMSMFTHVSDFVFKWALSTTLEPVRNSAPNHSWDLLFHTFCYFWSSVSSFVNHTRACEKLCAHTLPGRFFHTWKAEWYFRYQLQSAYVIFKWLQLVIDFRLYRWTKYLQKRRCTRGTRICL